LVTASPSVLITDNTPNETLSLTSVSYNDAFETDVYCVSYPENATSILSSVTVTFRWPPASTITVNTLDAIFLSDMLSPSSGTVNGAPAPFNNSSENGVYWVFGEPPTPQLPLPQDTYNVLSGGLRPGDNGYPKVNVGRLGPLSGALTDTVWGGDVYDGRSPECTGPVAGQVKLRAPSKAMQWVRKSK
jgi:hypothetical protein